MISDSSVRKEGSFIYEDFMPTDGTDVKVYTVGPDYAHAEARKSPALDGKVERDKDGKEVRYPVILSAKEKAIARQVCLAFRFKFRLDQTRFIVYSISNSIIDKQYVDSIC